MSKSASKNKSAKKVKKEEEPAPDLVTKDGASLKTMMTELRDKVQELQSKRNYVQNERDLLDSFANNTKKEIEELRVALTNKDTEAEGAETDHRVEVKVYMQKVKHLEYDQRLNARQAEQEGEKDLQKEDEDYEERLRDLQKDKTEMKKQYNKNEDAYQNDVKAIEKTQTNTMKFQKDEFDKKIQTTEQKYEDILRALRAELELKLKVEIHEIEERKNQHLNELIRNHEAAFSELKAYYNDITSENLNLIKTQKQRIEELQGSLIVNGKLITEIKAKNKAMEDPLERNRKLRDDLKYALRLHEKDKMALSNLRIKLRSLKEKITKTENEQYLIDQRYAKVIGERKDLEGRFEAITHEVRNKSDAKNVALSRKLGGLTDILETKEAQLQQLVKSSQLDPSIVNRLCSSIEESIESKNSLIKNIQYSMHHATKAYNDAIRVYEAKLIEFGVPADELGFQPLDTKTSLMPAGLVSSQ